MISYRRLALQIPRNPILRTQWHRTSLRHSSSSTAPEATPEAASEAEPEWFRTLQAEMLNRDIPYIVDALTLIQASRVRATLKSFVPEAMDTTFHQLLGHHLSFLNHIVSPDALLPDGTDKFHSPGEPFVRRLWAGGNFKIRTSYERPSEWWKNNLKYICSERIADVKLRGTTADPKVYVKIERRIGKISNFSSRSSKGNEVLQREAKTGREWGNSTIIEERDLVFMKALDKDTLAASLSAPIKYLAPPSDPDFTQTLTPTPSLLFRFSAITFNAHKIHLDPDYTRNVEGHRGLLVHGPLSLTLLLAFAGQSLKDSFENTPRMREIEYRMLAPLYANEPMRLCMKQRKAPQESPQRDPKAHGLYDVWIEGPTGGMAVKGTLHTDHLYVPPQEQGQKQGQKEQQDPPSNNNLPTPPNSAVQNPAPQKSPRGKKFINKNSHVRNYHHHARTMMPTLPQHNTSTDPSSSTTTQTKPPTPTTSSTNLTRKYKRRLRALKFGFPIIRRIFVSPALLSPEKEMKLSRSRFLQNGGVIRKVENLVIRRHGSDLKTHGWKKNNEKSKVFRYTAKQK